jgi:UDP-N-acetylmuramate dehydrogenase
MLSMLFVENASLADHSTMRLGGIARYLCSVTSEAELLEALRFASDKDLTYRIIGSGSNIIWSDSGYDGLIIVNDLQGFRIEGTNAIIGSGVNWDEAVKQTVAAGLSGIEFLSLIPGTTGATPVQNVGAYGTEIKDVFVNLRAYDAKKQKFVILDKTACRFGYRTSRFKSVDAGRFLITEVTLALHRENPKPPFYDSLQDYLDKHNIDRYTPQIIRSAVIAIRQAKLPSPDMVPNNGSFFANPIIEASEFNKLLVKFPDIKAWKYDGKYKIAAGWLVENAGFKDFHDTKTGMATWGKQSLVLVNESASSTADLLSFRDSIVSAVKAKFGVSLEQEPELL